MIANTPKPPYYAVIFSNILVGKTEGYEDMAQKMVELATKQPGYLGHESVREGLGITISYWKDKESIHNWKRNESHLEAQLLGKKQWYRAYTTRICKVERDYHFEK